MHQLECSAGLEALRPTVSTTVALPALWVPLSYRPGCVRPGVTVSSRQGLWESCLCGVCQAGVSCVKLPKCPPLRVTCRHTLWVPQVSIYTRITSDIKQDRKSTHL